MGAKTGHWSASIREESRAESGAALVSGDPHALLLYIVPPILGTTAGGLAYK